MLAGRRITIVLAAVAAGICLATGVAYLGASRSAGIPDVGAWLALLATLGSSGLAITGLWQLHEDGVARLLGLVAALTLAAGTIAANALALVRSAPEPPDTPIPLHVAGFLAGAALHVTGLVEVVRTFRRRTAPGPVGKMPRVPHARREVRDVQEARARHRRIPHR
jgi:hypothetical protein